MPENWMDWARLIGTFIGATVIAAAAGWQVYARIVRPVIKRLEPAVQEITGPGDEPGIRKLIEDVSSNQRETLRVANTAAEGVAHLTHRFDHMGTDLNGVKRDVAEIRRSQKDQGRRLGKAQEQIKYLEGRMDAAERVQSTMGCAARASAQGGGDGGGTEQRGRRSAGVPPPSPPDGEPSV